MNEYFLLGIAVVVIFVLFIVIKLLSQQSYPYYKNPYFISYAERAFYRVLDKIVPTGYYIFCQVSLNSLLKIDRYGKEYWYYLNKIRQKSVDFVIVDARTFDPRLVIELDDLSHTYQKRKERDELVNEALTKAKIPFLRIQNAKTYNLGELRELIGEKLK